MANPLNFMVGDAYGVDNWTDAILKDFMSFSLNIVWTDGFKGKTLRKYYTANGNN